MPFVLKLMFQKDMENRRSGSLDVGIGPLHMPDNQSYPYPGSIQADNLLRDEKIEKKDKINGF